MSFFQNSVLNKFLKAQDEEAIIKAYDLFTAFFHDPIRQDNIRNSKEEQFQSGFMNALFVNVLGYTLNPEPGYNLTTELKNEIGSKKADGAILKNDKALGVIELKDTDTKDLEKINVQAFNYKNNHTECVYVVTSNFEKLRFFINNAVEHIEFNLFTLTLDEFKLLWLCLQQHNLFAGIPLKVKEESLLVEENITKQLYKDYSSFKRALWQNMVKNHPKDDQLMLFKKTQKLLDRFLFILFAEDSGLLPPNSISSMLRRWEILKEEDAYKPLYEIFKQFFGYIDKGQKGKKPQDDIFAYNGGLFQSDLLLDNIIIDDEILHPHISRLTSYNFQSEVDVNILGHIFENSLNEIENITAELEGEKLDKSKGKRKKDGVFYTPKYITKYIVENTIGKLCEEKKAELNISDERFGEASKRSKKGIADLQAYRDWLLKIKICDPACGSGAFLNQALEFLIAEHRYLDELTAQYHKSPLVLSDVETQILEKNIYGVDINEESVDIAKLSLWLRTAQRGRKLTSLNNNIKCGNSLIDDPEVAGEKAFDWKKEFPEVFPEKDKRAFHVVCETHDSRTSQRMIDYQVRLKRDHGTRPKAEPIWLEKEDEVLVAKIASEIIQEDKLNVMAFNICGDHMHMVLVCDEEEVDQIVGKVKGKISRLYNKQKGITTDYKGITTDYKGITTDYKGITTDYKGVTTDYKGMNPLVKGKKKYNSLWGQKFSAKPITSEDQLWNTLNYIRHNRAKHKLPENKELDSICTMAHMSQDFGEAFQTEYKGGFDVVIGNPPYVKLETIRESSQSLAKMEYKTFDKRGDLYVLFVEKGFNILKHQGIISYIMPNKWLQAGYGKKLREYLLQKRLTGLIDFGDIQIFEGATTYPVIFTAKNQSPQKTFMASLLKKSGKLDFEANVNSNSDEFETSEFDGGTWIISSGNDNKLLGKLSKKFPSLNEFVNGEANYGIKPGLTEAFIIDEETKSKIIREDPNATALIQPMLRGRDIMPWFAENNGFYFICTFPSLNIDIDKYPSIKNHLLSFGQGRLEQSGNPGSRKKTSNKWFETQDTIAYYKDFSKPKIMYQVFQVKPCFIFDEEGLYCNNSMWILPTDNKALLGILNSKMGWWLITKYCTQIQNGYQLIWKYFGQIPIPDISNSSDLLVLVEQMIKLKAESSGNENSFSNFLQSKFSVEKPNNKLQNWHELEFDGFLKELEKARKKSATAAPRGFIHLTLKEEAEWMQYFNEQKQKAQELKAEINRIDAEIDQMVYELYGLTEEEIKVVEGEVSK